MVARALPATLKPKRQNKKPRKPGENIKEKARNTRRFRIPITLSEQLDTFAERHGCTVPEAIERMLAAYLASVPETTTAGKSARRAAKQALI